VWISKNTFNDIFEMDELWHFTKERPRTETRENAYVIPLMSRTPRQIVNYAVENSKTARVFQSIVDNAPRAYQYNTDGNYTYREVDFPGFHKQNFWNKKDTCRVESVNSDLRDYVPGLRRRSRCFFRSLETMRAVLFVFITAYNKFGEAKLKYRHRLIERYGIGVKLHNWYKDPPINLFQFVST